MKKLLLLTSSIFLFTFFANSQVTRINNNGNLSPEAFLNNNLALLTDDNNNLWVTNATEAGTFKLSSTISVDGSGVVLNGKYIFTGTTAAEGSEIFISDGTVAGTKIIKDIVQGATGSTAQNISDIALLNGFVYFIATTANEGSELWRTDGTEQNTQIVKDINSGPTGSNDPGNYELISTGSYLLFDVKTTAEGNELWRSDGTIGNAVPVKDIATGPTSSSPRSFYPVGSFVNKILFTTTSPDGTHVQVWSTNGTETGTVLVKDNINPSSIGVNSYSVFFHEFNGRAYFLIDDGTNASGIWSTDGIDATAGHTSFIKDLGVSGPVVSSIATALIFTINLPGKFIFSVTDYFSRFELWESDGSTGGTKIFKSFSPSPNMSALNAPFIFSPLSINEANFTITYPLYNGKFFFSAPSATDGYELWISDGDPSPTHTFMVKNIGPVSEDGITFPSYSYTTTGLYFAANDVVNGNELWKSDGTDLGTSLVKDINPNGSNSDPGLTFFNASQNIVNGKIMFTATDGDDPTNTDLFVVDGTFTPLPVKLLDFTVTPKSADAMLNWHTSQEVNSKNYTVQRSFDGINFENIGVVGASGNSTSSKAYSFTDVGIINSGKAVVYYRLMSLDLDGKGTASAIITLKIKSTDQWNVKLLSNPVTEDIKLLLSGFTENMQLSVIDIHGKKLYSIVKPAINGQISLPASGLPRGIYMLVTQTQNERKTIQFVK